MARRCRSFDEDDEQLIPSDERDDPLDEDMDPPETDDEVDMIRCPQCRKEVYAEAEQCSRCGHYLTEPPLASERSPLFVFAVLLMLAIIGTWVVIRLF